MDILLPKRVLKPRVKRRRAIQYKFQRYAPLLGALPESMSHNKTPYAMLPRLTLQHANPHHDSYGRAVKTAYQLVKRGRPKYLSKYSLRAHLDMLFTKHKAPRHYGHQKMTTRSKQQRVKRRIQLVLPRYFKLSQSTSGVRHYARAVNLHGRYQKVAFMIITGSRGTRKWHPVRLHRQRKGHSSRRATRN